jgi:hypothetical protein
VSDNDVCSKPLCRQIRRAHVWTNRTIAHAFIEPVPAPQPPADATACEDCEFDASFRCLVCSEKFCGKHAGKHAHIADGEA